ncbi:hypothetical protein CAEBREN_25037 [Caenorhabditis brenneri]|uniref:Uncharacterized protein n=1 Tax=Caenorhabditis brenneri TaxID=135651 RepID=G0P458_CAEBE|nr:hypothetical protein CAEBREN_25037 [Caenorhabditis brenneri]
MFSVFSSFNYNHSDSLAMSQNNNIYNPFAREEDVTPRATPQLVGQNAPQPADPPHFPNQALHVHEGRQAQAPTPRPQLAPHVLQAADAHVLRQNGAPTPQPIAQNQNLGAFGNVPRAIATPASQPANAQPPYVQPTPQFLQATALNLLRHGAPTPQPVAQNQNLGALGHAPRAIATPAPQPANARPANAQTPLVQPAPQILQATALHLLDQNGAPTPQPFAPQIPNLGAFGQAPHAIATPVSQPANARPANAQTPHPQLAPNFEAVQAAVVANFLRHVAPTPQLLAQNQNLGAFGHAPHAIATPALQPANSLQPLRMDPASFAAMGAFFQQIVQPQFNHGGSNAPNAVQIPLNPALVPARLPMTKDQIIQDANAWNANLIIDWNNMRKYLEDANVKNEKLTEQSVCFTEEIKELKEKLAQEETRHASEIERLQVEAARLQKDQEKRHKAKEAKLLEEKAELQKKVKKLMVDRKVFSAVFSGAASVIKKKGDKPSTSDTVKKIIEQGRHAIIEEIKKEKMESGQKRSADDKASPIEKKKIRKEDNSNFD